MKPIQRNASQRGQSLLILSASMVVFLALVSVVVDAGMDYVQRRQLFNSMDAAAQAGTLKVALAGSTNADVVNAVNNYSRNNGTDPANVTAYYVGRDAAGHFAVSSTAIVSNTSYVPATFAQSSTTYTTVGVSVRGNRTFNTYFARLIGFQTLPLSGYSSAYTGGSQSGTSSTGGGSCSATKVFPLALSMATFPDGNGDGLPDIHYQETEPSWNYTIYERAQAGVGNFGWLTWNTDGSSSTLDSNLSDTENSGTVNANSNIHSSSSSSSNLDNSTIKNDVQAYVNSATPVIIPVFDTTSGSGSSLTFHVIGFARFLITGINTTANPNQITGKFQSWVVQSGSSSCTDFGVTSITIEPPPAAERVLVGSLKLQRFSITNPTTTTVHVPVDVINLLDISGSMNDSSQFGGTSKITAAKAALTTFNRNMQPTLGDQVGLVVFPLNNGSGAQSGSSYSMSCGNSYSNYYYGQVVSALTGNYTSTNTLINGLDANGGTPTASGLSLARQTVLGATHHNGSVPVVIIASDGIANIRLNGQWTGFQGNTYESLSCNAPAEQDATTEANLAKSDLNNDGYPDVIIYSIAVGSDFNPSLLQAIATTDTDPHRPHYFRATDAASMASIYQQIAGEVQTISGECRVTPTEAFASGATVTVRAPDGTTSNITTSSSGEFVIPNAQVGTYQITGASLSLDGLTYNQATDGVGGANLNWPINVTVGANQVQYVTSFGLAPTTNVTCNH